MELEFYGAAGEVTGSCHLLRVGGTAVLLDCGMIQGGREAERRNREPFPFDPASIHAVVLSHAHIDHSGRLPLLVKRGFQGSIHAQEATRDLCRVMLQDSASLAESDAERENRRRQRKGKSRVKPLYTVADARDALDRFVAHPYGRRIEVGPGISVRFREAGHILGSASLELWLEEDGVQRKIVFSGDLGQYGTPILRDPAAIESADLVLMESTYGGHVHRSRSETVDELGQIIRDADRGNILIPAFAVGRSQEVLYHLSKNFEAWGLDRWQVFLDSPMAIEATEIYWRHADLHDREARAMGNGGSVPGLRNLHLSRSTEDSMAINRITRGAIIIAGSGMCTGGRILHHLRHNLWRPECHLIIVGYQANGTLGRRLVDGAGQVRIYRETIRVAARIHTVGGLSAHADENDLARWYGAFQDRPPVILVHGEPERAAALGERLRTDAGARITIAEPAMKLNLVEDL